MYVYSQEVLKDTEIIGSKMLIMYLAEDEQKVGEITDALRRRGVYFGTIPKSEEFCAKIDYVGNAEREIAACKTTVVMLSKAFFEDRNKTLRNITWFEIGRVIGLGRKPVLYFLDIPREEVDEYIHRTPVRQIQGCRTADELFSLVEKCNIMENLFYADTEINKYASPRIIYVKLTTVFNVFRKNIETMRAHLSRFEPEQKTDKEVLAEFLQELACGCTVFRFNRKETLDKSHAPYLAESDMIKKDYPVNFKYTKPQLLEYSTAKDIFATVKSDLILPVHTILGVDFKPFIAIKKRSRFKPEHIIELLKMNFNTDDLSVRDVFTVTDDKLQRAYFLLELVTTDGSGLGAGEKLNYLFPV